MKHLRLVLAVLIVGFGCLMLTRSDQADATAYHAIGWYRLKDFAMVEKDGVFHVYAIHECPSYIGPAQCDPTKRGFMHLTSTDLTNWKEVGYILPPDSRVWRSYDVWAPSIVQWDGTYYMFYTVVEKQASNGMRVQRISVATSTDLNTWTDDRTAPVFDCSQFSWSYWDLNATDGIGGECRDPFVTWDAANQQWAMYVSTRTLELTPPLGGLPHPMVIGVATSPDLEHWTQAARLDNTAGWIVESSHVFQHNGTWYLPWTSNTGIRYSTSPSLYGPFTNKGLVPNISADCYASEELSLNGRDFYGLIKSWGDTLNMYELDWNTAAMYPVEVQYGSANINVWSDDQQNGVVDPVEPGVDGMPVRIFADNGDGLFNPLAGDTAYMTLTTGDNPGTSAIEHGYANTTTLRPGAYWFDLDPALFAPGGQLEGYMPPAPKLFTVNKGDSLSVQLPIVPGGRTWGVDEKITSGDTVVAGGYTAVSADTTQPRFGTVQSAVDSAAPCQTIHDLNALTLEQGGVVRWMLSNDAGTTWQYWDGSGWAASDGSLTMANALADVRSHIGGLPGGTVAWKAIMDAPVGSRPLIGQITLSCDSAPSTPVIYAPASNIKLNTLRPTFSMSASDAEGDALTYELQLDTTQNFNSSSLQVVRLGLTMAGWTGMDAESQHLYASTTHATFVPSRPLPNGINFWRVRVIDPLGSGHFSPYSAIQAFQVPDALTLTNPVVVPLSNHSVNITWATNNPSDSYVWLPGQDIEDYYRSESVTSHSMIIDNLMAGSTYSYSLETMDIYGQYAYLGDLSFTVPLTVTSISNVVVSTATYSATITWTTNEPATSKVSYGLTTSYGKYATVPGLTTNHTVSISGLTPLKTYHFSVESTGGSTTVSPDATLITPAAPIDSGDSDFIQLKTPIVRGRLPILRAY